MTCTTGRGVACVLLALSLTMVAPGQIGAASPAESPREAAVQNLVSAAQRHVFPVQLFAPTPVVKTGNRTIRGKTAIRAWWQREFGPGTRLTVRSSVLVRGNTANVLVQLTAPAGPCHDGCWEIATFTFVGTRIGSMKLRAMSRPGTPSPPSSVPAPPSAPPKATPTIPT